MTGDYLIKLTLAVYQRTEKWEEKNFLKSQIRNLAHEILTDFILISYQGSNPNSVLKQERLFNNIEFLKECLLQARNQKLISRKDFLCFRSEYGKIKGECELKTGFEAKETIVEQEPERPKTERKYLEKKEKLNYFVLFNDLSGRQKRILEILEKKEDAQVWELKESFPKISKRTLRRDLDELLKRNLIKRRGEWNEVSYSLNKTMPLILNQD